MREIRYIKHLDIRNMDGGIAVQLFCMAQSRDKSLAKKIGKYNIQYGQRALAGSEKALGVDYPHTLRKSMVWH